MCTSKKIYKKIRSRVEDNKYRFFCKNCYENYYNNLYCEFCEQIYSNSCENEDDDKWIGCDNCERWVSSYLCRTISNAKREWGIRILMIWRIKIYFTNVLFAHSSPRTIRRRIKMLTKMRKRLWLINKRLKSIRTKGC